MKMTSFQFENHRRLPISSEYTLEGLYPNSLYHIWIAARSKRGEGATTPPIAVRTEQYGRYHTDTGLLSHCMCVYKTAGRRILSLILQCRSCQVKKN